MTEKVSIVIGALDQTRSAFDSVQKNLNGIKSTAAGLNSLLGGFGAGLSLTVVAGKLISVQREFDVLNSSLITVTGSAANAEREFAWIKTFASTTPFSLNEVTEAFVKMKALGLDATMPALTSYGNTASAMGKSLNQMVEAVADAATGEFERLKEFGIKARKSGDEVSLTFQGITKTIGNNAAEITKYLNDIGNNQFAGAMATRAATLDGALSNLGDTWDNLFRSVNKSNTGQLIFDTVTTASKAIEELSRILSIVTPVEKRHAEALDEVSTAYKVFSTTAQTLAVVGANVSFVFKVLANDVVSAATATGYAMTLQFGMAKKTLDQAAAYAKTQRAILDEYEKAVLFGQKVDKATSGGGAGVGAGNSKASKTGASSKAGKAKENPLTTQSKADALRDYQLFDLPAFEAELAEFDALVKRAVEDANDQFRLIDGPQFDADGRTEERLKAMRDDLIDILDPIQKYRVELDKIDELLEAGRITQDMAAAGRLYWQEQIDGAAGFGAQIKENESLAKDLGLTFSSAFEDAVVGGKKFSDVLKGLEQDIARIIIRKSVTEPLGNAISGIFSGINWGSIFGFGGGKATGGAVSAGTAYLVGEKGPELFVPNATGGIVPNHALGGGTVQINQTIHIDSRSDQGSILQAMQSAKEAAKAEILASMQRGGTFARATGRA